MIDNDDKVCIYIYTHRSQITDGLWFVICSVEPGIQIAKSSRTAQAAMRFD